MKGSEPWNETEKKGSGRIMVYKVYLESGVRKGCKVTGLPFSKRLEM